MNYDKDKVDEVTLGLLKGYIENPVSKAKSVLVTPEGCKKARGLFEKHFGR